MTRREASRRMHPLRRRLGRLLVEGFFRGTSRVAKLHPLARLSRHGVEVQTNVPYADDGAPDHLCDVYRPKDAAGPLPVVLYVHGGGFTILSKDTHWVMALMFARRGYLVVAINYRLAPRAPFPAALEDCAAAYEWLAANLRRLGGDPDRLVLAGESAGANLVTAMTIAATCERPEPYAKRIFDTGLVPKATLAACGILQVSDAARFGRRRPLPAFIQERLLEVETAYLPRVREGALAAPRAFADPLVVLEAAPRPARPLPPFFIPCGTGDPILDDSRRLSRALSALGVESELALYPGEPHAFHAFVWRKHAKDHWRDTFRFLDRALAAR